jgi:DNA-binding response OmpR family regulator
MLELRKIIYVDDISFFLVKIKERLKGKYEVYPAQSVEKMFEVLERIKPDLILLDVNMPDVNGFDAIGQIKADARYADIPVIFLTGQKDKKTLIKGMNLGAVDFITKPISDEKLISYIEYQFSSDKLEADRPILLAIDDSPSILQTINYLLGDIYTVYTLPEVKAEHVLHELLRKVIPDLFILDCNMPVLSGFDLIPIIRNTEGHNETPIIMLTSEGTIDHVNVAANLGACDYIIKPIDTVVLRSKVAKHMDGFIMRRRIRSLNEDMKK